MMNGISVDLRGAWRLMRRRPALAVLTILSLAIGISANSAVFSIARGVLLKPLPYQHPEELSMIWRAPAGRPSFLTGFRDQRSLSRQVLNTETYLAWRDRSRAFVDLAAIELLNAPTTQIDLRVPDGVERLNGALVTSNLFELLGVGAKAGRTFSQTDQSNVAVISERLWKRRFGGVSSVLDSAITVYYGRPRRAAQFTVVGVMPDAFRLAYPEGIDVWMPVTKAEIDSAYPLPLRWSVLGRLKPGVSNQQAEAELQGIFDSLEGTIASRGADRREAIRLEPVHEYAIGRARMALNLLAWVTAAVLLIACTSASTLKLAQVTERRRALNVQLALGASRSRIARQLITEGMVEAGVAGLIGIAVVVAIQPGLKAILPTWTPRLDELRIDYYTVAWTTVLVSLCVGLSAVAPLVQAMWDLRIESSLRSHITTPSRIARRLTGILVAAQAGLVSVLLVLGGMFLQSFWGLQKVDLGFDGTGVVATELQLLSDKYNDGSSVATFKMRLVDRLRATPGVTAVSVAGSIPFLGTDSAVVVSAGQERSSIAARRLVDLNYFEIARIPLVAGRLFGDGDAKPTVVISQSLASSLFPGINPIGRVLTADEPLEIVGVVADVKARRVDEAAAPAYYMAWSTRPTRRMGILIGSSGNVADIQRQLQAAVREIDPEQPLSRVVLLADAVAESLADRRLYAVATTMFGAFMLAIASAGLAGVLAYSVVQRRRELSIRAAIGSTQPRLMRLIIEQAMRPVVVGTGLGLCVAFMGANLVSDYLFLPETHRTPVIAAVAFGILTVSGLSCWIPAVRATSSDLVSALREG